MKHRSIVTCILSLALAICAGLAVESMPGGFSKASVTDKEVVDAAAFAIKAQQKAMQKAMSPQPGRVELVKILEAHQQVVAGMKYRLKLEVKVDGKEKQAETVVWWQAWRKPDPYRLTSWKWIGQKTADGPGD